MIKSWWLYISSILKPPKLFASSSKTNFLKYSGGTLDCKPNQGLIYSWTDDFNKLIDIPRAYFWELDNIS